MIRRCALRALARPPVWRLLRVKALRFNPVTILCYHTLSSDRGGVDGWTALRVSDFQAQLTDLQNHYDIVSLDNALTEPTGKRPRLVLSFDDGDRGLHKHLLPIVRASGLPVIIYVATEQFETGQPFWFDRVVNALQGGCKVSVDGLGQWVLPAEEGSAHWAVLGEVLQALKEADHSARDTLANQVVAQGNTTQTSPLGPMQLDELRTLAATPGVTIGAHSHGHELLDQIPLEQARESIARSRRLLQDWTGQEVRHFAFPNGNHTAGLRNTVADLGFTSAAILEDRLVNQQADPYALPRISIGRYDSRDRVRLRLVGL